MRVLLTLNYNNAGVVFFEFIFLRFKKAPNQE